MGTGQLGAMAAGSSPGLVGCRVRRVVVEGAAMMGGPFSVSEGADILGQPAGHILQAVQEGTDSHRWTRRISAVDALVAAERPHEALEVARRGIADGQVPGLAAAQLRLRVASNLLAQGLAAECLEELAILMRTNSLPSAIY